MLSVRGKLKLAPMAVVQRDEWEPNAALAGPTQVRLESRWGRHSASVSALAPNTNRLELHMDSCPQSVCCARVMDLDLGCGNPPTLQLSQGF